MMKKIALIISCIFSVLLSYAQGSGQSAKSVWEAYQADPSKMYTFIDGITNSNSPKDFIPYVQPFVKKCISRGVDWNVLYDEMKETILPKDPDVATYFGVSLAQMTYSYSLMLKALDAIPKSHTFDNDFIENAVIYPDGRIIILIEDGDEEGTKFTYGMYIESLFNKYEAPYMIDPFKNFHQMLLYQPEGNSMLGLLKYAGTKDDYSYTIPTAKANDKLELYVGIYLNKKGEKIGEKCMQYNSFAQALNAEKNAYNAKKKQSATLVHKKEAELEKLLVQKYGQKAYNAMNTMRPYVGMPEGIIRDFAVVAEDGMFKTYGFSNVNGVYKIYRPTSAWKLMAQYYNYTIPSAIYCKNGRVSAVKW